MSTSSPARTCPNCGNNLSEATQLCLVCMFRQALEAEPERGAPFSDQTPKPESGSLRFDQYKLTHGEDGKPVELGRGAMGVTYKAFDVDLQCFVALKVINERYLGDEKARLRFLREARAAATVRQTNVASVLHLKSRRELLLRDGVC